MAIDPRTLGNQHVIPAPLRHTPPPPAPAPAPAPLPSQQPHTPTPTYVGDQMPPGVGK